MTKPKTPEQITAKKQAFLRRIFGDDYANKTAEDFVRQAWVDTIRLPVAMRYPFYSDSAPKGSDNRAALQDFAKAETMAIAEKIQNGDSGDYAYEGNLGAADMLAKSGVKIAHISHIVALQKAVTDEHGDNLAGGKLKFGRAQKLLNMYLKYLWCAGKMPEPPHCPFDDIIINRKLQERDDEFWNSFGGVEHLEAQPGHENIWVWTQSDRLENYLVWLAAADEMAKRDNCKSIAEWELFAFEGA